MARYIFSSSEAAAAGPISLASAKRIAKREGATVVRAIAGSMLVEMTPTMATKVAQALPGWRLSPERKAARIPERRPLERAKVAASKAPTAAR